MGSFPFVKPVPFPPQQSEISYRNTEKHKMAFKKGNKIGAKGRPKGSKDKGYRKKGGYYLRYQNGKE